jgi:hypothetical protein
MMMQKMRHIAIDATSWIARAFIRHWQCEEKDLRCCFDVVVQSTVIMRDDETVSVLIIWNRTDAYMSLELDVNFQGIPNDFYSQW